MAACKYLPPLVDADRLEPIETLRADFPEVRIARRRTFRLRKGQMLLISDPTYLADVYRPNDDPDAGYVRSHAVFVSNFGGDLSSPVWWQDPFLVLPLALDDTKHRKPPAGVQVVANRVGCDSGSFVFLPLASDLPPSLVCAVEKMLREEHAVSVSLPAGTYRVFYEQPEPLGALPVYFSRSVVARRRMTR